MFIFPRLVACTESAPDTVDDIRETVKGAIDKTFTQENVDLVRQTGSDLFSYIGNALAKDKDVPEVIIRESPLNSGNCNVIQTAIVFAMFPVILLFLWDRPRAILKTIWQGNFN